MSNQRDFTQFATYSHLRWRMKIECETDFVAALAINPTESVLHSRFAKRTFRSSYPKVTRLRRDLCACLQAGQFDDMLESSSNCLFVPYIVHRASHWSTAVFAKNQKVVSITIDASPLRTIRESSRVEWFVGWSGASGTEMGGRVPPLEDSTDELSDQGVLLSGFYIFKRSDSTPLQNPGARGLLYSTNTPPGDTGTNTPRTSGAPRGDPTPGNSESTSTGSAWQTGNSPTSHSMEGTAISDFEKVSWNRFFRVAEHECFLHLLVL